MTTQIIEKTHRLITDQLGHAYIVVEGDGNHYALRIGSKAGNALIYHYAQNKIRKQELKEINEQLIVKAHGSGQVWNRVGKIDGGIEIDIIDGKNTRLCITAKGIEIIKQGSTTLFTQNPSALPMVMPAKTGDIRLLKKHTNLDHVEHFLFVVWIAYTLAHPKEPSTKYLHLVVQGEQGSGKSSIANIVVRLLDPSRIKLQIFPKNANDLAIASQHSHVLSYDNMRYFKDEMSDILCVASTGGSISTRALYTDSDQAVNHLHAALVLNGRFNLIHNSDLAQRCLILHTKPMAESSRRSEEEIAQEFERDLPFIFRGLLDLIVGIFQSLPQAKVVHPERMYAFVKWLAAAEVLYGVTAGTFQYEYSQNLKKAQLNSLMENHLGTAIIDFVHKLDGDFWEGTPTALLSTLSNLPSVNSRAHDWPQNAIALSKRLQALKSSLLTQNISVVFHHGTERQITVTKI